jgi:hypothetical protein
MSGGDGCGTDGGHCGDSASSGGGSDGGYGLGPDGKSPVPNIKRVEVNGAPVIEQSHVYVMKKSDAPNH